MNPFELGLAEELMQRAGAPTGPAPQAPAFDPAAIPPELLAALQGSLGGMGESGGLEFDPTRPLGTQQDISDLIRHYLLEKARQRDQMTEALQDEVIQANKQQF